MFSAALSRNDRRIRTCRFRAGESAPVHRLRFMMEEALRLASLPGESEGRVYYFRSVHVSGLPKSGDRRAWLDAFQAALLALAGNAVHGLRPDSHCADAVFFRSEQEACEALLFTALRGRPMDAWFWGSVSETTPGASASAHATGAIAKLSRSEASWIAVAAVLFACSNPIGLLELISEATARFWLGALCSDNVASMRFAPSIPRDSYLQNVHHAARVFDPDDPRVVWLTAMAVILECPAEMERGTAVPRAHTILQMFRVAKETVETSENRVLVPNRDILPIPEAPIGKQAAQPCLPATSQPLENPAHESACDPEFVPSEVTSQTASPIAPRSSSGEHTEGAGLYFLLNAFRYIKVADSDLGPGFLAHFFGRVASLAGIDPRDPILSWVALTLEREDTAGIDERVMRARIRKVRRWCWRHGRIGLRALIRRPGKVTLTRTHLDISLSLDSVDVRVRRIGLDIDPGWLPWFGRVVRFHYLSRGEMNA